MSNQETLLTGPDLQSVLDDSRVAITLADQRGIMPAVWGLGSGPGAAAIRSAVTARTRRVETGDVGQWLSPQRLLLTVGSNTSLPQALRRHVN